MSDIDGVQIPFHDAHWSYATGEQTTIERTVLPSGARVLTESMPGAHSATVGFWVPVGSRDEAKGGYGSTHFLEHLLFKGTHTRSALDIAVAFDEVGGESNAVTAKEYTCYYAKVRDADVPMAIRVIADMLADSLIDSTEFEHEREVILEELAMAEDDPADVAHELFATVAFGDSALGRPIVGTPAAITAVGRDHVWDHYRANYHASDIVVAVAGAIDHEQACDLVAGTRFGTGSSAGVQLHPRRSSALAAPAPSGTAVKNRPSEQANVVMGTTGLAAGSDRRFVMSVLSTALGGGVSSRLFQEVRERRGLVYSVYSFGSMYSGAGTFGMYAASTPAKLHEVVEVMRGVAEDFAAEGVTEEELVRSKGQLAGAMTLGLEDTHAHMARLGRSEIGTGELVDLPAAIDAVESVSARDVDAMAAEFVAGPKYLAAVGPITDADL